MQMLCGVLEQIQQAVLVTDMSVAGLPITYCNTAMARLTGYERGEIRGRNCRFLQGPLTEAAAVRHMVDAIRTAACTTVALTNYRRDGSTFMNQVTLVPVLDSAGAYRYNIGLLADSADCDEAALLLLRSCLPRSLHVNAQPPTFDPRLREATDKQQHAQYAKCIVDFTRIRWMDDIERTFRLLVSYDSVVRMTTLAQMAACTFSESPEDLPQLNLLAEMMALADLALTSQEAGPRAMQICEEYFGIKPTEGSVALATLEEQETIAQVAANSFVKFIRSKACLPLIAKLRGRRPETPALIVQRRQDLLWRAYAVPQDSAQWLHALCSVSEAHSVSMVVSDMMLPGNPMVYVNPAFCALTGYTADEAKGRNCRFLQGPETEPEAVAYMIDTLRRGADCYVRVSNYRKSGDIFYNVSRCHSNSGAFLCSCILVSRSDFESWCGSWSSFGRCTTRIASTATASASRWRSTRTRRRSSSRCSRRSDAFRRRWKCQAKRHAARRTSNGSSRRRARPTLRSGSPRPLPAGGRWRLTRSRPRRRQPCGCATTSPVCSKI